MSSSWLWQPFGSCSCLIMVPTSQYCLPLTSGLENSHIPGRDCIGDPLYWHWDPAHRDLTRCYPLRSVTKTRQTWTGTGGTGTRTGTGETGDRATGPPAEAGPPRPGHWDRATGTRHWDRATGTGHTSRDQTKINLYP